MVGVARPYVHLIIKLQIDVQIETAGTLWSPELANLREHYLAALSIVCSPKTGKIHIGIAA